LKNKFDRKKLIISAQKTTTVKIKDALKTDESISFVVSPQKTSIGCKK